MFTFDKEGSVRMSPRPCYKIYRRSCKEGEMISPFTNTSYRLKEGDEIIADGVDTPNEVYAQACELGKGYIHALIKESNLLYSTLDNIRGKVGCVVSCFTGLSPNGIDYKKLDEALNNLLYTLSGFFLSELEIPAGERHWLGVHGDICARRMIFKKELKLTKSEILRRLLKDLYLIPEMYEKVAMELIRKYKEKGE